MRFVGVVGLVFAVGVRAALAQTGAGAEAGDRARLVEGVREIAAPGAPGSLAVYAASAFAVATGDEGGGEVAAAACGRLGRGRVVAFAHDGYFSADQAGIGDTARLLTNALGWAAKGKPKPRVGLIDGHGLQPVFERRGATVARTTLDQRFQGFDVLVLTPYRLSVEQGRRIRAFVQSGGGLLAAATGWGWQQGANRPMAEFDGNRLLAGTGLSWTDGFAGKTGPKGFLVGGEISPFVNAATALELLGAGREAGPKDLAVALSSIRLALRAAPDDAGFRARVRKLLGGLARGDLTPTPQKPARADDPPRRFAVGLEAILARQAPIGELRASPASRAFPGAVTADAPRGEHRVEIDASVPGWHSLGLYAAPGETIRVTVPREAAGRNLAVQIGCHTDSLWALDSWERVPEVVRRFPVASANTAAANAFGGLIYIDVPEGGPPGKLVVAIKNAVRAPLYRLGETTLDEWKTKQRGRPAPWAELAAKNVILTVPSSLVRRLDDPKGVLTLWDEVVAAQDAFVSSRRRERPERIVADVQISAGYMHSGYPIMVPIDESARLALDETRLRREGSWGHFHEIGHNHQSGDWTFDGTGEVTNNLIVLYVFDRVLGLRFDSGHEAVRDRDQRNRRIRAFMAKGAPFEEWKSDPFLALMMYIQVYEAFGPDPFKAVFAEYAKLPDAERPRSDEEKRDQWMVRLSRAVGKNLGPFFQAWGVPTGDRARASIETLPAWMPEGFPTPSTSLDPPPRSIKTRSAGE